MTYPRALTRLAQDTEGALTAAGRVRNIGDVGPDLAWASFNLRAARMGQKMVVSLAHGRFRFMQSLNEEWDIAEVAAMSLSFGDVATALDLCADAIYRANAGSRPPSGAFWDLGQWGRPPKAVVLQPASAAWVKRTLRSSRQSELKACRDALTHRRVRRDIAVSVGASPGRSLARIAGAGSPGAPGPVLGDIGILIPRMVAFGESRFRACCQALRADFT